MVRLNKPHRSNRPEITPLEKTFAKALCCVYYHAPQDQHDEAVDQLIEELKAEKLAAQTSNMPSLRAKRSNPGCE